MYMYSTGWKKSPLVPLNGFSQSWKRSEHSKGVQNKRRDHSSSLLTTVESVESPERDIRRLLTWKTRKMQWTTARKRGRQVKTDRWERESKERKSSGKSPPLLHGMYRTNGSVRTYAEENLLKIHLVVKQPQEGGEGWWWHSYGGPKPQNEKGSG